MADPEAPSQAAPPTADASPSQGTGPPPASSAPSAAPPLEPSSAPPSPTVASLTGAPTADQQLKLALDGLLGRTLPPLFWGLGGFYVALALFAAPLSGGVPPPQSLVIAWAASGVAFLIAAGSVQRRKPVAGQAHVWAMAAAAVVLADDLLLLWATNDPGMTIALLITLLGFALLMFSTVRMAVITAAALVGWLAIAWPAYASGPAAGAAWTARGIPLVAVGIVAVVVQRMRVRTHERIESLRRREVDRALQEHDARSKARFLQLAADELAAPVTPLLLQVRLLRELDDRKDPRRTRALDLLNRNLVRLNGLVGDVVRYASYQAGVTRLDKRLFGVHELVARLVRANQPEAEAAGVAFELTSEPAFMVGDEEEVAQAIAKLLHNARRFSPPGGKVRVDVRTKGARAIVRVADNGPGAKGGKETMFDPFSKADTGSEESGAGLGLAVARLVAEAHKGTVWHEDNPDGGSVFTLAFPSA